MAARLSDCTLKPGYLEQPAENHTADSMENRKPCPPCPCQDLSSNAVHFVLREIV